MKKITNFFLFFFFSSFCFAAVPSSVPIPLLSPVAKFDFRSLGVATAVQLIYSEVLQDSYVIDPDVLSDQRVVSFRYDGVKGDVRAFVSSFFDSLGLAVSRRGSVDYVSRKVVIPDTLSDSDIFIYRPRFRDGGYLTEILSPLFKGTFTTKRAVRPAAGDVGISQQKNVPFGSALASIDQKADTLIFTGSANEIEKLKKFLPQVDFAVGDVLIKGVLFEVQTGDSSGSGFAFALNLLGSKLGVSLGAVSSSSGQGSVSFKSGSIDAVITALETDSRFKAVSKPMLRVRSGSSGRFTVGQDVPVLGSISYPGNGLPPVQSVTYQSSGVILDLLPVIHDSSIDVSVMQQTSNFVSTLTGVSGSPTLIKRELKTELNLTDGEMVVMGGLSDSKDTVRHSGLSFLPAAFQTKQADKVGIEILLILQVIKIH